VSAAEAALIRAGQPARLATGATGEVRRLALQADPATRLVEAEIAFPPDAGLVAGPLVTGEIRIAEPDSGVPVPRAAVRDGQVWAVGGDGTARARRVTTGLEDRERVEILDGLQPGERVVVEGAALLSEGARVRVVNGGGDGGGDV